MQNDKFAFFFGWFVMLLNLFSAGWMFSIILRDINLEGRGVMIFINTAVMCMNLYTVKRLHKMLLGQED